MIAESEMITKVVWLGEVLEEVALARMRDNNV